MSRFAERTKVPVARTQAKLLSLLKTHGATETGIMESQEQGLSVLLCRLGSRMLRFEVMEPDRSKLRTTATGRLRSSGDIDAAVTRERRRRWRVLYLLVRAKLEVIESGDSTVDGEFLSNVLLPNGQTAGQTWTPALDRAYSTGEMPALPMLPAPTESR